MKITIPTELSEITLGQLQGLNDIENKGLDGVEKQKQTIELLANVKRSVLDRFKLSDLQNVYNKLLRLTKEDKRLVKFVNIDGVKYGFHPNLSNITTGEFVDLDTYCQDMNANLDKILAILYREVTFEKGGKYQIATYDGDIQERANLFNQKLPANVVNGAILFFWTLGKDYLIDSITSFKEQAEIKSTNNLAKSGAGIQS